MANEPRSPAIDELHRRVGRNLLQFQSIEQGLRFLLPYIDPATAGKGDATLPKDRKKSVETLGDLITRFKGSTTTTHDAFESELEALRIARNDLVHCFYQNDRFNLLERDGLAAALAYLDDQHKHTQEWAEIIRVQTLVVLLILIETNDGVAAQYGEHREKLVAQLPPSLEIVDAQLPQYTIWASTRIVKLLRLAELRTETVDGKTLLSRAGHFIRAQEPDLSPREYGLRALKEVLSVSGLFEISVAEDSTTISYRSKPELRALPLGYDAGATAFSLKRSD